MDQSVLCELHRIRKLRNENLIKELVDSTEDGVYNHSMETTNNLFVFCHEGGAVHGVSEDVENLSTETAINCCKSLIDSDRVFQLQRSFQEADYGELSRSFVRN